MDVRRSIRRAWMLLAALPLAFQVGSEASGVGSQPASSQSLQAPPAASSPEFFEASVRPVLAANCYDCHADDRMGGLRLDSREAMLRGGRTGPALVPGDADKSLIIQAVRQTSEKLKMPKGGRLRPEEIEAQAAHPLVGVAVVAVRRQHGANARFEKF